MGSGTSKQKDPEVSQKTAVTVLVSKYEEEDGIHERKSKMHVTHKTPLEKKQNGASESAESSGDKNGPNSTAEKDKEKEKKGDDQKPDKEPNTAKDGAKSKLNETQETSSKAKPETKQSEEEMRKEADGILEEQVNMYKKTKPLWKNEDLTSQELQDQMKAIRNSYTSFSKFIYRIKFDYRGKLLSPLMSSGSLDVVIEVIVKTLEEDSYFTLNDQGKKEVVNGVADTLSQCLQVVCSFTDTMVRARQYVVDNKKLLPLLVRKLEGWYPSHIDGTRLDTEKKMVNRSLTVLFMIAAQEDRKHMDNLRELENFFPVVKKYLSSKESDNKLTAIATLAYVSKEAEAKDIATDKDIIRFVLDQLRQAYTRKGLDSPSGWTITGLAKAVKNLARNDANKRLLVQEGAVQVLYDGLKEKHQKSHNFAERKCCLESLWWLSFDPQNREEMAKKTELLDQVVKIYEAGSSNDPYKCYAGAEGFLFQMREHLVKNSKYARIAKKLPGEKSEDKSSKFASPASPSTEPGHIMMSYQTQHRSMVKSVCDFIRDKGKLKVWMDIYNMAEGEESTLQTMAEAVEGSAVVLMCVSESYKNSPYCRAEAEYAFMKNKHIIPLKLQKGYTPDGWLGIIQGSKFFFDFTKEGAIESKRQQLLEAVRKATAALAGDSAAGDQQTKPAGQSGAPATTPRGTFMEDKVKTWTKNDIKKWLTSFNLSGDKVENMTADEILYLYNLKSEAPDQFHAVVRDELGLTGLARPASFNKALAELPSAADEIS